MSDAETSNRTVSPRVGLFVTCLVDLLYRWNNGELAMDVPAIVSNHKDLEHLAQTYDIPFHHLPVSADTKHQQEARLLEIIEQHQIDCVVLARYMQIIPPALCEQFAGRLINIHHSFLPSFVGANPYQKAYDRGVKLIGATAHYVTTDLDEGPIIEQDVVRVDHTMPPKELERLGQDVESTVLNRAVRWHAQHRVFENGNRTIVLRH